VLKKLKFPLVQRCTLLCLIQEHEPHDAELGSDANVQVQTAQSPVMPSVIKLTV